MSAESLSLEEIQRVQQQKAEMEERRLMILDQILEPAAKERLSRLSLVKKEKARAVEDSLIAGATNGRLKSKVSEEQLIIMLEQISGGGGSGEAEEGRGGAKRGVVIQRRKYGIDDDDDEDDSDLL
mmetsp:Transcript_16136/g.17485  ORF Transcript_16136/g.17485 Transcript_16136/m.17485 type:complete len:126 (-) Transcript_16136:2010-2387(-)|eukprot:gene4489-4812_t